MRIAVYGATGMIGSQIVAEALARGHEVTGVTRSGGEPPAGVVTVVGDASDPGLAKRVASAADVVVSAIGPSRTGGDRREFLAQLRNLAESLGGTRLLVVGGAGSLLVDGQRLVDRADFPEIYRAESLIGAESLDYLRGLGDDVDWTYLSPAPLIQPGERTGGYRVALDSPAGESISAADYAIAMLDEIDRPAHRRQRFTVAS
jgi:putative NADH-flavin reductase